MPEQSKDSIVPSGPFQWAAATDVGKVRHENQDTSLVEPELGLFLVSDGMGGHRGGALAANIVAEDLPVMIETRLSKLKSSSPRAVRALFKKVIVEQSRQLQLEATSGNGYKGMGATLVMALLREGRAYVANLGDSRMYRLRNGRLIQLTQDHSVVAELLSEGKIKPEEAENHAAAGQITGYIGTEEKVAPYIRSFTLKKNDLLLLCTDGLTGMVSDADIARLLETHPDVNAACAALVKAANAAGGHDNTTVIAIHWLGRSQ